MQSFVAELIARAPLSQRVVVMTFLADRPFLRRAGQYVELLPRPGEDSSHAFSMASPFEPSAPNRFEIAALLGTTAGAVLELPIGARIVARGPSGNLVWQGAAPSLFVATGTGVSPLRALIAEELARDDDAPLLLLFGCRDESEELWGSEFRELARQHSRFAFWPTFSQPARPGAERLGRVQAHVADAATTLGPQLRAYLCGHTPMVKDCSQRLVDAGVLPARIHGESY